jgi:hypothetical protein
MEPISNRNDTHTRVVVNADARPTSEYAADVTVLKTVSTETESSCADMAPFNALPLLKRIQMNALIIRSIIKNKTRPTARGIITSTDEYIFWQWE